MTQTERQRKERDYDELTREEKEQLYYKNATEAVHVNQKFRKQRLEEMTNMTFKQVLYDSNLLNNPDNIEIENLQSILFKNEDMKVFEQMVMLCENDQGIVLGCYFDEPQNVTKLHKPKDALSYKRMFDWNTHLFIIDKSVPQLKLTSLQLLEDFIYVPIAFLQYENGITITIGKDEFIFNQKGRTFELTHKMTHYFSYIGKGDFIDAMKSFNMKRFQVWKMHASEQSQIQTKIRQKEIRTQRLARESINNAEETKLSTLKETLEKELHSWSLKISVSWSKITQSKILLKLQEWTGKTFTGVKFQSESGYWKQGRSTFNTRFSDPDSNYVILFEDKAGNAFGVYLTTQLSKTCSTDEIFEEDGIVDPNAFVFTFANNNKGDRYFLKEEMKTKPVVYLFDQYSENLIQIGTNDLLIRKEGNTSKMNQNEQSSFDYGKVAKPLVPVNIQFKTFSVNLVTIYEFK